MRLWVEKYRPQRLDQIAGNATSVKRLQAWVEEFRRGEAEKKALLLHGPPGSGKTSAAYALARELGYDIVETNASDIRTKTNIERVVGTASKMGGLDPGQKGRILLVDEVDGIHGRSDFGGLAAIKNIIRKTREPIVLLANDPWALPADFRGLCEALQFKRLDRRLVLRVLKEISAKEGIAADEKALATIATNANGDLRAAINDLQSLGQGGRIGVEDSASLFMRDSEEGIFKVLSRIFKTESCARAREAVYDLDEDPETILHWLAENLPREYEDPSDLARGFDSLSRADLFLGRIKKRQSWRLLGYASDLMTCGVSLSKRRRYHRFTRYQYPAFFAMLARTRAKRDLTAAVSAKISRRCHVSTKVAAQEFIPLVRALFRDPVRAARLSSYFGFEQREIELFDPDRAKEIYGEAQKITAERITTRGVQTALF
ncbi:MAG: replication factor C large subunit [Methanobacteriota archaeon]|nr:MAG: replication factor C large subunit [Euryarchaeota archaeon]